MTLVLLLPGGAPSPVGGEASTPSPLAGEGWGEGEPGSAIKLCVTRGLERADNAA